MTKKYQPLWYDPSEVVYKRKEYEHMRRFRNSIKGKPTPEQREELNWVKETEPGIRRMALIDMVESDYDEAKKMKRDGTDYETQFFIYCMDVEYCGHEMAKSLHLARCAKQWDIQRDNYVYPGCPLTLLPA